MYNSVLHSTLGTRCLTVQCGNTQSYGTFPLLDLGPLLSASNTQKFTFYSTNKYPEPARFCRHFGGKHDIKQIKKQSTTIPG